MSEAQELHKILNAPTEGYWEAWQDLSEAGYEREGWKTVAVEEGDEARWSRHMYVITQAPSGKYYQWSYERGLTEYQEDYLPDAAPVEVEPKERTIVEKYWEKVA